MSPKMRYMEQKEWLYKVTGVTPDTQPYAPNLTAISESWLRELPPWFYKKTRQYSGWVSDGEEYGDKGRYAGLISNWDQCHLNIDSVCFRVQPVKEDERFVYQGNVTTLEGSLVPVSILAGTVGHADDRPIMYDPYVNTMINQGFYDNDAIPLKDSTDIMAHQLIYGRYLNTPEGIAFVGAVFPHVPESMIMRINASPVSGTWIYDQTIKEHLFTGVSFVNKAALPLADKDNVVPLIEHNYELKKIAASARYNYIMAVDTTQIDTKVVSQHECSCKDKNKQEETIEDAPVKIDAASDPTVGEQVDALSPAELTTALSELLGRVSVLEEQVSGIDREVANLIRSDEDSETI